MSDEGFASREKFLVEWAKEHNPASRTIRCVELDMTFNKIKDAADYFGFTYSTFCSALRKGNTFGGYTWERMDPIVKRRYHYHKDGTPNRKPIICVETGEIFPSAKDLAPILGVLPRTANEVAQYGKERNGKHYIYLEKGEVENGSSVTES